MEIQRLTNRLGKRILGFLQKLYYRVIYFNFLLISMNITIPLRNFNSVAVIVIVIVIVIVVVFCFFHIFVNNIYIQ